MASFYNNKKNSQWHTRTITSLTVYASIKFQDVRSVRSKFEDTVPPRRSTKLVAYALYSQAFQQQHNQNTPEDFHIFKLSNSRFSNSPRVLIKTPVEAVIFPAKEVATITQ
jgi:hypothetical protein